MKLVVLFLGAALARLSSNSTGPLSSDENPTLFTGTPAQEVNFARVVSPSYTDPANGAALPTVPTFPVTNEHPRYNLYQSAHHGGLAFTRYLSDGQPGRENMATYSGQAFLEKESKTEKAEKASGKKAKYYGSNDENPTLYAGTPAQTQNFASVVSPSYTDPQNGAILPTVPTKPTAIQTNHYDIQQSSHAGGLAMTAFHSDGTVLNEFMPQYSGQQGAALIEKAGNAKMVKAKVGKAKVGKAKVQYYGGNDENPTLYAGTPAQTQNFASVVSPSYTDPQNGALLATMPTKTTAVQNSQYDISQSAHAGGLAMTAYHSDGTVLNEFMPQYSGHEGAFIQYDENPTLYTGAAPVNQNYASVVSPSYTDPQNGGSLPSAPTMPVQPAGVEYNSHQSANAGGLAMTAYHSNGTVIHEHMPQYSGQALIEVAGPNPSDENPTLYAATPAQSQNFARVVSPSYTDPANGQLLPSVPTQPVSVQHDKYNIYQSMHHGGLAFSRFLSDGSVGNEVMATYSGQKA